jgi:hypothetical protein
MLRNPCSPGGHVRLAWMSWPGDPKFWPRVPRGRHGQVPCAPGPEWLRTRVPRGQNLIAPGATGPLELPSCASGPESITPVCHGARIRRTDPPRASPGGRLCSHVCHGARIRRTDPPRASPGGRLCSHYGSALAQRRRQELPAGFLWMGLLRAGAGGESFSRPSGGVPRETLPGPAQPSKGFDETTTPQRNGGGGRKLQPCWGMKVRTLAGGSRCGRGPAPWSPPRSPGRGARPGPGGRPGCRCWPGTSRCARGWGRRCRRLGCRGPS